MGGNSSVSIEVYDIIKNKIIDFEYKPGQILIVQRLSQEFAVSRTPVREALVRLEQDGFLEETQGRKFKVQEITWKSIQDLYKLRIVLESEALRSASENMTKMQLRKLRTYTQRFKNCLENKDYAGMFENDLSFHNAVLSLSGNEFVTAWAERIGDFQQRIRYITINIESRLWKTVEEHERIMAGIESGDVENAVSELRVHLEGTLRDIDELRKTNPFISQFVQ